MADCRNQRDADKAAKFSRLYSGDWTTDYKSQSEADNELINVVYYYSRSDAQVERLFTASALYRADGKGKDYVQTTIGKQRAKSEAKAMAKTPKQGEK